MHAMILDEAGRTLRPVEVPVPVPGEDEVLLKITACGVCRTDLHIVDGELTHPKHDLIPGHEIVGVVSGKGARAEHRQPVRLPAADAGADLQIRPGAEHAAL